MKKDAKRLSIDIRQSIHNPANPLSSRHCEIRQSRIEAIQIAQI